MKPLTGVSRAATWLAAVEHLMTCSHWEDYNLVLEIAEPMRRNGFDRRVEEIVDAFLRKSEFFPLPTVAGTIFPAGEYRRHGPTGVYETYPDVIYPDIKKLTKDVTWGTYAHRLVRRQGPKGPINPLQICVEKIKKELAGTSVMTACYELSLSDLSVDLPIYEPGIDCNRRRGGPCLSHVSVKVTRQRRIQLTALYRYHYYVQKALGNLMGLAHLQAFVCEQTKLEPGPLVCVSTFATLQETGGVHKSAVERLVASLRELKADAGELSEEAGDQCDASD